jgi:polyisoprenoid-binding protein YceI
MTTKYLLALLSLVIPAAAAETSLELDPARTTVAFSVPSTLHTVHGMFKLKRGALHFDPETGKASGEIVVDASSGASGDDARDHRLQKEILEAMRFPDAVFTPDRVMGTLAAQGDSTLDVHGMLQLHGAPHEMTLHFTAKGTGGEVSASTQFVIPYIQWGLKNPSNFLLKVKDKVELEVQTIARVQSAASR